MFNTQKLEEIFKPAPPIEPDDFLKLAYEVNLGGRISDYDWRRLKEQKSYRAFVVAVFKLVLRVDTKTSENWGQTQGYAKMPAWHRATLAIAARTLRKVRAKERYLANQAAAAEKEQLCS